MNAAMAASIPLRNICTSKFLISSPNPSIFRHRSQKSLQITRASSSNKNKNKNNGSSVPAADRILAASSYLLPFLDGFQYGRFILTEFPAIGGALQPLFPLVRVYRTVPFAGILAFFGLYFGVVRNQSVSRYVRFNTMQAVVLDVLLIIPDVLDRSSSGSEGYGVSLLSSFDSTVFLFLVLSLLYGTGSCLFGQVPRLPVVADAADSQVF